MSAKPQPRYPVYVISKGRANACLTAQFLIADGTPFHVVIEPQEEAAYAATVGRDRLLLLPFSNLGRGSIPARNWVWEHAKAAGFERHWILDDNIRDIVRKWKAARRITCNASVAFAATEDFIDRYENVAIGGMNYSMFGICAQPPFYRNVHVYSCLCILNGLPYRWRGRYNEDTDLCLQVLAGGWCTISMNAFLVRKMPTGSMKGGNADELYKGDGRLKMARSLERLWPGVVEVKRRFRRPQHVVKDAWKRFDTPLRLKPGISLEDFAPADNYGMALTAVREIRTASLRQWASDVGAVPDDGEE